MLGFTNTFRVIRWSFPKANRYSDLILAAFVVMVVSIIVVPLPPLVLDFLLTLNITIAVVLLMLSTYISSPLKLAAFPTILLLTTLLRLSLNISSTRLILLHGRAGEVIQSFGTFVVSGDVIVGGILFLIITLVQFLVITKGAERVAEVGARFTLDAMPGKQMSIDAELRMGTIEADEAKQKRADLSTESQLYGAMDGAMKFVKGDAIAGLLITAINIVAGLIIGIVREGMPLGDALQVYSILTIGDGLVSQIPALLISICAGVVITRVTSDGDEGHLGDTLGIQLLSQPKAIAVAGAFLFVVAMVPGMPTFSFLVMGSVALFGGRYLLKKRAEEPVEKEHRTAAQQTQAKELRHTKPRGDCEKMLPMVTPILIEFAPALSERVDEGPGSFISEQIPNLRNALFFELGVRPPHVRMRANPNIGHSDGYIVYINEVPVSKKLAPARMLLANESQARLKVLNVSSSPVTNPITNQPNAWVKMRYRGLLNAAKIRTWEDLEYIALDLSATLRRHADSFIGLQEVQAMLDQLEKPFPTLIRETVPRTISVTQLTDILRRLVSESISIRDLKGILHSIATWAPTTKDNAQLVELIRRDMRSYLSNKYTNGTGKLQAFLLDEVVEESISCAMISEHGESYVALDPEMLDQLDLAVTTKVNSCLRKARQNVVQQPIFLTHPELRNGVYALLKRKLENVTVLSHQELDSEVTVEPLARIQLAC